MVKYRYIMLHKYILLSGLLCSGILPSVAFSVEKQTSSNVMKSESNRQPILNSYSLEVAPKDYDVYSHQDNASHSDEDIQQENTKKLSKAQLGRIASLVRSCFTQDIAAKDYASFIAHMIVTVDNTGTARIVDFDFATKAKMSSNPSYRLFTERSRDAVLNPKCSKLPIPSNMLGHKNTIQFVFKP